jgi:hypothetical protein
MKQPPKPGNANGSATSATSSRKQNPTTTFSQKKRVACVAIEPPTGPNLLGVVDQAMKEGKPQPRDQIEHNKRQNNREQHGRHNDRDPFRREVNGDWTVVRVPTR